nr:type VII secretion-associated protein [Gordonia araii]
MRRVASVVGPVRLLAVDRSLLNRFGAHRPLPPIGPVIVPFSRRRVRRWPAAVAVVTVAVGIVGGVLIWPKPAATTALVDIGGVRIDVPGDWRRTDLAGEPAPRAAFVEPETGSRIVVAVSPLRADATIESVAASLGERIKQRGDDAVSEFAERAMFAGQMVVAYRETPDSGAPIRWYVRVLRLPEQGQRQVSVGCQDAGSPRLEQACRRAVAVIRA